MKYNNFPAFEKHLAAASPAHFSEVYFILTKDDFDRKRALDKVLCVLSANRNLSISKFQAEHLSPKEMRCELDALGLFTERRIIVLNDVDKMAKNTLMSLEEYLARPNPRIYLILTASSLSSATTFYKRVEKVSVILELPQEKPWEREKTLTEWAQQYITAKGNQIDRSTCQSLVKQLGADASLLQNEIDKLCCYIDHRTEITIQDIKAICINIQTDTVWQLGEAIFRRNLGLALRISQQLLATSDGSWIGLIRQLRSQFQTGYTVSTLLATGKTPLDVTKQFPYMTGRILDNHLQMAQSYGMERFKRGMMAIDEFELLAKNSYKVDDGFLNDLLLLRLIV